MDEDTLLTITQATKYLRLRQRTRMFEIAQRYHLGRRVGDTWYFTRAELDAYKATRRLVPASAKRMRGYRVSEPPESARTVIDREDRIDINEAATILDVSVKRVYVLASQGRIGTKHDTRWSFSRAEVEAYKATRNEKGGRPRK